MEQDNFDTQSAAKYLKSLGLAFRPGTLEVWRCKGRGPKYKRVARKVFYERSALDEFARGHTVETVDSVAMKR